MIHVAPCSCELHVRIRELEAELAKERDAHQLEEAWYARKSRDWTGWRGEAVMQKARAEKAEARVAELEKKMWLYVLYVDKNTGGDGLTDEEIRAIIDRPLPFKESLVEHGFIEKVKPAPAIEGQEREAD